MKSAITPTTRQPLSKKLRFEVFKRDAFCCQYCGQHPPLVVLEVDHIVPVSKNGPDVIDNLITSCFDCNRGKSNIELNILPEKTIEKIELILEKEEQYKQYQKLLSSVEKRIRKEAEKIDEVFSFYFPKYCLSDGFKNNSLRKFLIELGFNSVYEAMQTSCGKNFNDSRTIRYFCGICWSRIKGGRQDG